MPHVIILKANRGGTLEVKPDPPGNHLFLRLAHSPPASVELFHVKWSGEALFFIHNIGEAPADDYAVDTLEPGMMAYFPKLAEFILSYGISQPRDQNGCIKVARVGQATDIAELRGLGNRIWRRGTEKALIWVKHGQSDDCVFDVS